MTDPTRQQPGPAASEQDPIRTLDGLPALTRRTRRLIFDDDPDAARRLLADALAGIDASTAPPDARLIDAASVYASLLADPAEVASTHPDRQRGWSQYAADAAERAFGTHSETWQSAAAHHADLLSEYGHTADAVAVHQRRLSAYRLQHRRHPAIASTRRALAIALHDDGQCEAAWHQMSAALHAWRHTANVTAPSGRALLRTYLAILAACGKDAQARAVVAEHGDLFGPAGSCTRDAALTTAAHKLRDAEVRHPPVCRAPGAPTTPRFLTALDSFTYWHAMFSSREHAHHAADNP
jgi:hypothetical protein